MINKNQLSLPFCVSVIAAFTAANSLISAPFYGGNILAFIVATVAGAVILTLLSRPLTHFFTASDCAIYRKILYAVIVVLCVLAAGLGAKEYCVFIYRAVLVRSNIWMIKVTFCLCVFFLAVSEKIAIYKFSLLTAVMSGGVFLVLFILSAKNFNIKNLYGIFDFAGFSFPQAGIYLLKMILPTVIAVIFTGAAGDVMPRRSAALSFTFSTFLSATVVFDSVLSFGLPLAAKLPYSYIDDISTVNVGSLFTRMDAFAYFAFFACYIVKCAICLKLAAQLLHRTGVKYEKAFCAIAAGALMFF